MNEPTPEQIEAAAEAIYEHEKAAAVHRDLWPTWAYLAGKADQLEVDVRRERAKLALVAAAGVTPQEPGECQCYGADGVTDPKCPACSAPVRVDEAKLAEVLLDHAMDFEQRPRPAGPQGSGYVCECGLEILEPRTGPGIGWWHRKHLANAVSEWLRGGGQ